MSSGPVQSSRGVLRVEGGRELVSFGGCDYLGLANDEHVFAAARAALENNAFSAGGSRVTSGTHVEHLLLESELAALLGCEDACLTGDGLIANMAALEALARRVDVALVDAAAHASLDRAARAAGLERVVVPHLDVEAARADSVLLVDGWFPMRGELAPVAAYHAALPAGAWLLVDDAHALGVVGARGWGSVEELETTRERLVITGTLSKAIGAFGGFVASTRELVADVRKSEAYVCTTPIPAHIAAAARAALAQVAEGPSARLVRLRANLERVDVLFTAAGSPLRFGGLPVLALDVDLRAALERRALFVPRVEYPGDEPRWRVVVSADHDGEQLARLVDALIEATIQRE